MSNFDDSFKELIGQEGGVTKNPKDPGDWTGGKVGVGILKGTKLGIAANTYPHLDIENLTVADAKTIYRKAIKPACFSPCSP
jgi:lysozyme family protein